MPDGASQSPICNVHPIVGSSRHCQCSLFRTDRHIVDITSGMIHGHGASLSEQQAADLLICHGTQQDLSLSTVTRA